MRLRLSGGARGRLGRARSWLWPWWWWWWWWWLLESSVGASPDAEAMGI